MTRTKQIVAACVFALLICAPVKASNSVLTEIQSLFSSGRYNEAAQTATEIDSPGDQAEALSIACKSRLIMGGFQASGIAAVEALHDAIRHCAQALQENPAHFEARFNLAVALGFEGRRVRGAKYAMRSREEIETLINLYPESAIALGALAGWHAEAAKEGFLARAFLGASRKKADRLFGKALESSDDIALEYEFLRFLASGGRSDRIEANTFGAQLLTRWKEQSASSAFEAELIERAEILIAALRQNSKKQVVAALERIAAFPDIENQKNTLPKYPLDTIELVE